MQLESSAKIQTFLLQTTFSLSGLNIPNYTSDSVGSAVTSVNVDQTLGLNALGISLFRMNDAPSGGLNPAHIHPRGTEIFVVLEAELNVGFATSNPNNRLVSKTLYPGDVFVFAVGIIHFQRNVGKTKAVAFAGLRSQNPGVITIPNAVSGSNPAINTDVLTTEIFVVLEAKLNVGFVTSNPNNRLVSKTLDPGDVFVFPVGIIHFQRNVGKTKAVAFAGLSSQNPGAITIPNAVSGSNPAINTDVLTKAFQLIKKVVKYLQSRF